jgi:hypothetical protein
MSDAEIAQQWKRIEREYERRRAQRIATLVERVLVEHRFRGRLGCHCGKRPDNVDSWGRHVLTIALNSQQASGDVD